jgi:hypothetical protein
MPGIIISVTCNYRDHREVLTRTKTHTLLNISFNKVRVFSNLFPSQNPTKKTTLLARQPVFLWIFHVLAMKILSCRGANAASAGPCQLLQIEQRKYKK